MTPVRFVTAVFLVLLVCQSAIAAPAAPTPPVAAPTPPTPPVAAPTAAPTAAPSAPGITRTPSLVPIGPSAVPVNPATTVVTLRLTGVTTLPVTSVVVDRLLTSLAAVANTARSAVTLANAQVVSVSNANIVQVQAFIVASSAAEAANVATRINADVQDGTLGTGAAAIGVQGVTTAVTPSAPMPMAPSAPSAPSSPAGRVRARFSVIVTGIDLSGFSADTAAFRTSVSNMLKLGNPDYVTIVDKDLITYARKFTASDVGVRVIFDASMPDQASANSALSTLQAAVAANGNKIGSYEVRNLQTTTSDGSDAAVWLRPMSFLVVLVGVVAMMF